MLSGYPPVGTAKSIFFGTKHSPVALNLALSGIGRRRASTATAFVSSDQLGYFRGMDRWVNGPASPGALAIATIVHQRQRMGLSPPGGLLSNYEVTTVRVQPEAKSDKAKELRLHGEWARKFPPSWIP